MAPTAPPPNAWALHSATRPDNVVELAPSGSLNRSTARFMSARLDVLIRSGYDTIIVDCSNVDRVDEAGWAPLVQAAAVLDALGGRLVVTDLSRELAVTQLEEPAAA